MGGLLATPRRQRAAALVPRALLTTVASVMVLSVDAAQQRLLAWTVRASRDSPRAAEFWGQLLGPVQFPLLRRSLRRAGGSMAELEAVLRPVLVPGEDGRAIAHWHHNNHLRAFARAEFLWRKVVGGQQQQLPQRLPWEEEGGGGGPRLPRWSELVGAFEGLEGWNRQEGTGGREEHRRAQLLQTLAAQVGHSQQQTRGAAKGLTLLHVGGGGAWLSVCRCCRAGT